MEPVTVTLGEHEVPVVPQRHAYLTNRLGSWVKDFADAGDLGANDLLSYIGGRAYEIICVMIPPARKRIPEWEWSGYGSEEAWKAGEYDEEADKSPTMPEIINALEVAISVNRFDVFKALTQIVDPKMLRQLINAKLAEQILTSSLNSSGASGAADLTSSGTTARTTPLASVD